MVNLIGKFNWLRKANVLADYLYQVKYENIKDGVSPLRTSTSDLASLVSIYFNDKDGHRISQSTFKTYLQKSRNDKRPKDESGNRIIANLLPDDE